MGRISQDLATQIEHADSVRGEDSVAVRHKSVLAEVAVCDTLVKQGHLIQIQIDNSCSV